MSKLIGFTMWISFIGYAGCTTYRGMGPYKATPLNFKTRESIKFGSYKCDQTDQTIRCIKP